MTKTEMIQMVPVYDGMKTNEWEVSYIVDTYDMTDEEYSIYTNKDYIFTACEYGQKHCKWPLSWIPKSIIVFKCDGNVTIHVIGSGVNAHGVRGVVDSTCHIKDKSYNPPPIPTHKSEYTTISDSMVFGLIVIAGVILINLVTQ